MTVKQADCSITDDVFEAGLVIGLLIGEGHFGGDGKQPHVSLRMHVRHEPILRWFHNKFNGSKLYGPYHHGGRHYFQWMCRGECLKSKLIPMLQSIPYKDIDPYSFNRFKKMCDDYKIHAND